MAQVTAEDIRSAFGAFYGRSLPVDTHNRLMANAYANASARDSMGLFGGSGKYGSSGIGDALGAMVTNYNQQFATAKQANEQRYQQAMTMYNQDWARKNALYQQSLNMQAQNSGQQEADISRRWDETAASQVAQLGRLGLATSGGAAFVTGAERNKQEELRRLRDSLISRQAKTVESMAGLDRTDQLKAMERKQDEYPDLAALQNLLVGIGSYSGSKSDMSSALSALANIRSA